MSFLQYTFLLRNMLHIFTCTHIKHICNQQQLIIWVTIDKQQLIIWVTTDKQQQLINKD